MLRSIYQTCDISTNFAINISQKCQPKIILKLEGNYCLWPIKGYGKSHDSKNKKIDSFFLPGIEVNISK